MEIETELNSTQEIVLNQIFKQLEKIMRGYGCTSEEAIQKFLIETMSKHVKRYMNNDFIYVKRY